MTTMVRLEAVRPTGFDAALARLGGGRLTRAAGRTYLESDRATANATCHLALAGVRATPSASIPAAATRLRPAIALDLVPLDDAIDAVDVLELQRIPLSDTTAALMHRRLPWLRRPRATRATCLRLLREDDAVIGWRRIVWCSVASMRVARERVRLRPVVFDRAAVERQPLRWAYVSEGAMGRWAFA